MTKILKDNSLIEALRESLYYAEDCRHCPIYSRCNRDILGKSLCDEERADEFKGEILDKYFTDTVEPGRWIPVSERLPEEYEDVLISINYIRDNKIKERYTVLGSLTPKGWALVRNLYQLLNKFNEVVAWLPLPEPYKAESEG